MYMLILILFYFVAQVFILMSHPPPSPFSAAVHFNPLVTTPLPRLFPTPSLGRAAHVCMVRLAAIWRSYPSGFLYKQPQFTVSSVVPVEFWKSTPPSLQFWLLHCHFFLLYYSFEVSLFCFNILLLFLTIVDF